MWTCTGTHVDIYTPTRLHTYTPTHLHTYTATHLHTYTPTQLHSYTATHLHTYTHTYTQARIHTCIYTHRHAGLQACRSAGLQACRPACSLDAAVLTCKLPSLLACLFVCLPVMNLLTAFMHIKATSSLEFSLCESIHRTTYRQAGLPACLRTRLRACVFMLQACKLASLHAGMFSGSHVRLLDCVRLRASLLTACMHLKASMLTACMQLKASMLTAYMHLKATSSLESSVRTRLFYVTPQHATSHQVT